MYGTSGRAASDEVGALSRLAALDVLHALASKATSQHSVGREEGGALSPARGDHGESTRAQHARDLREEWRHIELGDEVEGVLLKGQVGGIGDLERDPSLRI